MTYAEIQKCYKAHFNKAVKTCWIADVKRQLGLPVRKAHNRKMNTIINKCPQSVVEELRKIISGQLNCSKQLFSCPPIKY